MSSELGRELPSSEELFDRCKKADTLLQLMERIHGLWNREDFPTLEEVESLAKEMRAVSDTVQEIRERWDSLPDATEIEGIQEAMKGIGE